MFETPRNPQESCAIPHTEMNGGVRLQVTERFPLPIAAYPGSHMQYISFLWFSEDLPLSATILVQASIFCLLGSDGD